MSDNTAPRDPRLAGRDSRPPKRLRTEESEPDTQSGAEMDTSEDTPTEDYFTGDPHNLQITGYDDPPATTGNGPVSTSVAPAGPSCAPGPDNLACLRETKPCRPPKVFPKDTWSPFKPQVTHTANDTKQNNKGRDCLAHNTAHSKRALIADERRLTPPTEKLSPTRSMKEIASAPTSSPEFPWLLQNAQSFEAQKSLLHPAVLKSLEEGPSIPDENARLWKNVEKHSTTVSQMQKKIDYKTKLHNDAIKEITALQDTNSKRETEKSDLLAEKAELHGQVASLSSDKAKLTAALIDKEKHAMEDRIRLTEGFQRWVADLQAQHKKEMEDAEAQHKSDIAKLDAKHTTAMSEREEQRKKELVGLASQYSGGMTQAWNRAAALDEENKQLQFSATNYKSEVGTLKNAARDLKNENQELNERASAWEERASAWEQRAPALEKENRRLQKANKRLAKRVALMETADDDTSSDEQATGTDRVQTLQDSTKSPESLPVPMRSASTQFSLSQAPKGPQAGRQSDPRGDDNWAGNYDRGKADDGARGRNKGRSQEQGRVRDKSRARARSQYRYESKRDSYRPY